MAEVEKIFAFAVMGAVSFWLMVSGSFKCNSGSTCWLSLFGRVAVILLLVFALGRLQEKLEQYKRGEPGVIRGVLIPLVVFAWMFNYLIRPMIRTERWTGVPVRGEADDWRGVPAGMNGRDGLSRCCLGGQVGASRSAAHPHRRNDHTHLRCV